MTKRTEWKGIAGEVCHNAHHLNDPQKQFDNPSYQNVVNVSSPNFGVSQKQKKPTPLNAGLANKQD